MGTSGSSQVKHFECCYCGRSVNGVADLRTSSPLDTTFLLQHGRYQDARYYASNKVLTNVGYCSSKCFSKKLVLQSGGNINVTAIAELLNNDAKQKLTEKLQLDPEGLSSLTIIPVQKLKSYFLRITEAPQSYPLDSATLVKCIGRGPAKTGTFSFKKFSHRFAGHVIGACRLDIDDGGARGCAVTCVVFFVADGIEFSGRHALDLECEASSGSDNDPFND